MSTAGLLGSDRPLAESYDLALVDLDGVTYKGHEPIEGASEGLARARAAGLRLVFVTNNASREPEQVAHQLSSLAIPAGAGDVMTAAQAAARLLRTRLSPGDPVLVVGGAGLFTAVRAEGLRVVETADAGPVAVVQGFAPEVGWTQLAEAAYAIEAGAWHVASNRDLSLPTARGFAPGNGALVAAVVSATGVEPSSAGKPEPTMYAMAVDRAGAHRPLVIGDRLDTDLAGARAGGYDGLHVLTGVSSARDDVLAAPGERPHFIGADLLSLLEPHPAPAPAEEGWFTCRGAAARVDHGSLELHEAPQGPTAAVDLVRAACAAAWAAADRGEQVAADTVPELPVR